jgi:hypothetical protein
MEARGSSYSAPENICIRLSRPERARRSHLPMIAGRIAQGSRKGSRFPADERWVPGSFTLTPAYTIITQIHPPRDLSFHFNSFHQSAAERTHHPIWGNVHPPTALDGQQVEMRQGYPLKRSQPQMIQQDAISFFSQMSQNISFPLTGKPLTLRFFKKRSHSSLDDPVKPSGVSSSTGARG